MLDHSLKSSVFLPTGKVLTPSFVAEAFKRAVLHTPNGWQPEAILRHTRTDTSSFSMRSKITPSLVRSAYFNAINRKVIGFGIEAEDLPTAHLIISHVADDARLSAGITPEYIHDLSMSDLSAGSLRSAVYHFQSTECSQKHRKAFFADDVRALYKKVDEAKEFCLVSEIFRTTENTNYSRAAINPEDARRAFIECLGILEGKDNQGKWQAGRTAMDLLRYTIDDRRFREVGGITQDDIEKLKQYFIKMTQLKPRHDWEMASHKAVVVWKANCDLNFVTACTLNPKDVDSIRTLRDGYKTSLSKRYGNGGPDGWYEADCIKALESYPALKAEMVG